MLLTHSTKSGIAQDKKDEEEGKGGVALVLGISWGSCLENLMDC